MTDYTKLTTEDFQAHCTALYAEQDRRAKLDSIPNDVKQLAQDFETLGGNREQLFEDVNTELVAEKLARETKESIEPEEKEIA